MIQKNTCSLYGYGKLSSPEEYKVQGRGGKGVKAGIFNDVTGNLVNLKQVTLDDDIIMIADDGTTVRTPAKEVSLIGRNTKGVKVMKLKNTAKIVCVAVAPKEEDIEVIESDETIEEVKKELDFEVDTNAGVKDEF